MMTTDVVEIYEDGSLRKTVDLAKNKCEALESSILRHHYLVDDRFYDLHILVWPAGSHSAHQTRHVVTVICDSGPRFKFSVKPEAGSLALEVESTTGIVSPVGLIGQFFNSGAYSFDSVGNIVTGTVHIPSDEKQWHKEGFYIVPTCYSKLLAHHIIRSRNSCLWYDF